MAKIKSLHDLFVHELRDLFSAEKQLLKALPKMAKAATHEELKEGFEQHLQETEAQVERLEQIFEKLGVSSRGEKCVAMEGLIEEGKKLMEEEMPENVLDAALIGAAQKIEHYEIAGYGTAKTFAEILSEDEAADLLEQTLNEEKETDTKLTELAENNVNADAETVTE
jgi:ferritin-like metal-binding protein YciE